MANLSPLHFPALRHGVVLVGKVFYLSVLYYQGSRAAQSSTFSVRRKHVKWASS